MTATIQIHIKLHAAFALHLIISFRGYGKIVDLFPTYVVDLLGLSELCLGGFCLVGFCLSFLLLRLACFLGCLDCCKVTGSLAKSVAMVGCGWPGGLRLLFWTFSRV